MRYQLAWLFFWMSFGGQVFGGASMMSGPRVLAVWVANPFEVALVFDRPLAKTAGADFLNTTIEFQEVSLATVGPSTAGLPKDVATNAPGHLRVVAAQLARDRRTLTLTTDPHPLLAPYRMVAKASPQSYRKEIASLFPIHYTLNGLEVTWNRPNSSAMIWSGWLPEFDLALCRRVLADSPAHQTLFKLLAEPGQLTLRAKLAGFISGQILQLSANRPFQAKLGERGLPAVLRPNGSQDSPFKIPVTDDYELLTVILPTGSQPAYPELNLREFTNSPPQSNLIPARLWMPWAPPPRSAPAPRKSAPSLAGGQFQQGKELFHGNLLKCGSCHRLRNEGGQLCPDLGTQYQRDVEWVLNDIADPNAYLNPNYVSFNLTLRDGLELTGFVKTLNEQQLQVTESDGKPTVIRRADLQDFRASAVSMMPSGLLDYLTPQQTRDLLTFILAKP